MLNTISIRARESSENSTHEILSEARETNKVSAPLSDPNPPYGEKGGFRKVTITLPPEIYELLLIEATRRKIAGEPNRLLSSILREAVTKYLGASEIVL